MFGPVLGAVEARLTLAAEAAIRRAVLLVAATLCGIGTLVFLSLSAFFALLPGVGPAGAALILALLWGLLAALCYVLSLARPRRAAAATLRYPAVAVTPPGPPPVRPVAAVGVPPPRSRLAARISRTAPLLAIGALLAGIIAGRK
jgi:hypothetical protein